VPAELVLIVEDNERNLRLASEALHLGGFRTLEARTAAEAVELAVQHRPDVVLLDIQLPDRSGVEAMQELRARPSTATIPAIALTAFAMSSDRDRFLAAGFDGYIAKPIDVRAFADEVRRFCRPSRLT
jgi:two-component system, cell cycle response regulator DivK